MKFRAELDVYLYDVIITPENICDAYITHGIFRSIRKRLSMIMDIHVISGKNLFTTTNLEESILIKAEYNNQEYDVLIDSESKHFVSCAQMESLRMEDHSLVHNLINIIIKQAFRETNLR